MKSVKKFLSFLLIIVLSCSIISCAKVDAEHTDTTFYPEGYTCGFPNLIRQPGSELEFWWVETYDECLSAIDLLKSNGSSFVKTAIFTYECDLFDTKYCIKISGNNINTEKIKFGDNPFDRKAFDVEITSYAFFDDVSIDEINYGDIENYHVYLLRADGVNEVLPSDGLRYEWGINGANKKACYVSSDSGKSYCEIVCISCSVDDDTLMSDDSIDKIIESIVINN